MHQKFPFEARRGVQAKEKFGRPNWCLLAHESPNWCLLAVIIGAYWHLYVIIGTYKS